LPPAPTSGPEDLAAYYIQHGEALRQVQLIGGLGAVCLLLFVSGLGRTLGRLQGTPSQLAVGVVLAGVAVASMSLTANAATLSIVLNDGRVENPGVVQTLHDFTNSIEILMSLPLAVVVALTSWVLVRGHGAVHWIALVGIPMAVLLVFRTTAVAGWPALPFPPLYPGLVRGARR